MMDDISLHAGGTGCVECDPVEAHKIATVWRPILPVPADAPDLSDELIGKLTPKGFQFVAKWPYHDRNGQLLGYTVRYDGRVSGSKFEKQVKPFTYCEGPDGKREWRSQGFPEPRPLYGVIHLVARPGAPVLVVEGEKTADAARKLFPAYVVITSPGGSSSARKCDWVLLAGRRVVLWPDADDPGKRYAEDVADMARRSGATPVHIVKLLPNLPKGWDLGDPIPKDIELDVHKMVQEAPEAAPLKMTIDSPTSSEASAVTGKNTRHGTQASTLIRIAGTAGLFHSPDDEAFADFEVHGHRETWPVKSKRFKSWLTHLFFQETGSTASTDAFQKAMDVIEATARFNGKMRPVFTRVGASEGKLYLDLVDQDWRVIEIDAGGWRPANNPPVRFRRSAGMEPLPMPQAKGSIDKLRPFLNLESDEDFVLVVSWLLAGLRDRGPYPLMALSGEQGSAKSTFSQIVRALVDPNKAPLRSLPRNEHDLFIAANNSHMLAFDNLSGLPAWISDVLCCLATGAGFAARRLYSDSDEMIFKAARPIILNGIGDIVARSDLADRALFLELKPIPGQKRRTEEELWADFIAERPAILGALLDGVSKGMKELPSIKLDQLPRMADFALWASACETAFFNRNAFMSAYDRNRDASTESMIEADPVADAVRALIQKRGEWRGTASALLGDISGEAGERITSSKTWPAFPRALRGRLDRAAPSLRKVGIDIRHERSGHDRTRIICINVNGGCADKQENIDKRPSASSAKSARETAPLTDRGISSADRRAVRTQTNGNADGILAPTVRPKGSNFNAEDGADGADEKMQSGSEAGCDQPFGWGARI
jgi:hypothetical protein